MNSYDLMMKPLEDSRLKHIRKKLIAQAHGVVLELGAGTGVNLENYKFDHIKKLILTDLILQDALKSKSDLLINAHKINHMQTNVENISLADNSVDTVVATLVFCSVDDVNQGLMEIKRVLKPEGQLIFIEHVISPNKSMANVMNFLTPVWKRLASNCHLNRDFLEALTSAGFEISQVDKSFKQIFVSGIAERKKAGVL